MLPSLLEVVAMDLEPKTWFAPACVPFLISSEHCWSCEAWLSNWWVVRQSRRGVSVTFLSLTASFHSPAHLPGEVQGATWMRVWDLENVAAEVSNANSTRTFSVQVESFKK